MAGKGKKRLARVALDFQPDAVQMQTRPLPGASRLSLYLLLLLLASLLVWAWASQVDRIVTARGRLVTVSPPVVVQPLETSLVRSIRVRVGQVVRRGQVLGALDPTFTEADVGQLTSRLSGLKAEIKRLKAEKADQGPPAWNLNGRDEALEASLYRHRQARKAAQLNAYDQNLSRLQAALATSRKDQVLLRQRLAHLTEIEKMRETLLKSRHESRLRVLEIQNQRISVQQELSKAVNAGPELLAETAKVKAERRAYLEAWQQEVSEALIKAERELDETTLRLSTARKRKDLVELKSPRDAMVLAVAKLSVGSVVRTGETLFSLAPINEAIEAEIKIAARDIGFIRKNDQVRVKFDAFPYQKHGVALAKIRFVSEDAFSAREQSGENPSADVFFLARLNLEKTHLRNVPPDFRLIPGMTLSAEIKVGKRSVMDYLVYPILKGLDTSLREP